jgi:simple sugar transport system ATP-binding protein
MTTGTAAAAIELDSVTKRFGATEVLRDVSLSVNRGEVLCLLGDNGAGKSTVIKLLSGVYGPTSGRLLLDGTPSQLDNPRQAQSLGITTVHQDVDTFPLMSVTQNFFLGREITTGWGLLRHIDVRTADKIALEQARVMGLSGVNDPRQLVGTMSGGERQALAIGRAMYFGARVLILDEPTSALGVRESDVVLDLIDTARKNGLAVVFVTHNAHHAIKIGDRFTVLNRGNVADQFVRGERSHLQIISLMAGGLATDLDDLASI